MSDVADRYVRGLAAQTKYFATWFPNLRVDLGDYGVLEGKRFRREGSLRDFAVDFRARSGASSIDFDHTSGTDASIGVKASGGARRGPGHAGTRVKVSLGARGAWIFQAAGCKIVELRDRRAVGLEVLRLHEAGLWSPDLVFVDSVISARRATILVSTSRDASVELAGDAHLRTALLPLATDAGIQVHAQSGSVTKFLNREGLTPLFSLARVERSIWRWLGAGPKIGRAFAPTAAHVPPGEILQGIDP